MLGKFVRFVEQSQGIWEQIYAYYNLALWYAQKTYYSKAIKSLEYTLELLSSHKHQTDDLVLLKADAYFNMALARHADGNVKKAIESMKEAHQHRIRAVGKNSLEVS